MIPRLVSSYQPVDHDHSFQCTASVIVKGYMQCIVHLECFAWWHLAHINTYTLTQLHLRFCVFHFTATSKGRSNKIVCILQSSSKGRTEAVLKWMARLPLYPSSHLPCWSPRIFPETPPHHCHPLESMGRSDLRGQAQFRWFWEICFFWHRKYPFFRVNFS